MKLWEKINTAAGLSMVRSFRAQTREGAWTGWVNLPKRRRGSSTRCYDGDIWCAVFVNIY